MVPNRIRERRGNLGVKQQQIVNAMIDMTPPVFSAIETGRVMPTKDGMTAICETLDCQPEDLYDVDQLILTSNPIADDQTDKAKPKRELKHHASQVEFRSWIMPAENAELREAIKVLGYRSSAEWMREMLRNTVERARAIKQS